MNSLFDDQEVTIPELIRRIEAIEAMVFRNEQPGRTAKPLAIPDAIKDAWARWDAYRKVRKGWTEDAKKINVRKLMDFSKGNPAIALQIVELSIERGYQGLFPLKADIGTTSAPQPAKMKTVAEITASQETPYERKMNWLRQQLNLGAITQEDYEQQAREARR